MTELRMRSSALFPTLTILFLATVLWLSVAAAQETPPAGGEKAVGAGGRPPAGPDADGRSKDDESNGEPSSEAQVEARARASAVKNFEDLIVKRDANKDGKLSLEELGPRKSILRFDKDGDGLVDRNEFIESRVEQARERHKSRQEARERQLREGGERRAGDEAARQWAAADKNRDGKLAPDESPELFGGEFSADANGDNFVHFEELIVHWENLIAMRQIRVEDHDKNGDGAIAADEAPGLFEKYPEADKDGDKRFTAKELENAVRVAHRTRREEIARAPEARLAPLDSDKDGKVTVGEAKALVASFPRIDGNKDGVIAADELKRASIEAPSPPEAGDLFGMSFRRFDKDGDGKLTGDEAAPFIDKHPDADSDQDGSLSQEEVRAVLMKERDRPRDGEQGGLQFARFDRDGDGKISKDEHPTLLGLPGLDKDGNGEISREEFDAHFKRPKEPSPTGGPEPPKKPSPPPASQPSEPK